jgi:hypothetical protein
MLPGLGRGATKGIASAVSRRWQNTPVHSRKGLHVMVQGSVRTCESEKDAQTSTDRSEDWYAALQLIELQAAGATSLRRL